LRFLTRTTEAVPIVTVQDDASGSGRSGERPGYTALGPASLRNLTDEVAERLREAILRGDFAPGQPLRETRLASILDVSRGPVREALARLEREGLVLIRRNRGATVARLSNEDLTEVYTLRLALEELAARWAARNATDSDFAAMQAVLDGLGQAVARGMYGQEYAMLDVEFHDCVYRAARHKRLYRCWTELRPQIYVFLLSRNVARSNFSETAIMRHRPLMKVLQSRDAERAVALTHRHVEDSYSLITTGRYPERAPDELDELYDDLEPVKPTRIED
jgi:DNA-binding GntR family transcriptional regulator